MKREVSIISVLISTMNWYKKSQQTEIEEYLDIGHRNTTEDTKGKFITLWISDLTGGNFRMKLSVPGSDFIHERAFDLTPTQNFYGRHDPFKNAVSITLPLDPNIQYKSIDVDKIPNRLVSRLVSEFPGSSIYAFNFMGGTEMTQII